VGGVPSRPFGREIGSRSCDFHIRIETSYLS
jgi:hypothetical protein